MNTSSVTFPSRVSLRDLGASGTSLDLRHGTVQPLIDSSLALHLLGQLLNNGSLLITPQDSSISLSSSAVSLAQSQDSGHHCHGRGPTLVIRLDS